MITCMPVSQPLLWVLFCSALLCRLWSAHFPERGRPSTSSPVILANLVKGRSASTSSTSNGWRWILFRIHKIHRSWAGFARSITLDINSEITYGVWLFVVIFCLHRLDRSKRQDFQWALRVCSIWMWTKPIHCSAMFENKVLSCAVAEGNAIFHFSARHDSPSWSCLWFRYI